MSVPGVIAQPTPQTQQPATAALTLLRASLEALSQKLGQTLPATVLGTDANGLTQLKLGDLTLAVKLSQPLPAGTQVQITVQPVAGTISLAVQPRVAAPVPLPAARVPLPVPPMSNAPVVPIQVQMPAVVPPGQPAAPTGQPIALVAAPTTMAPPAQSAQLTSVTQPVSTTPATPNVPTTTGPVTPPATSPAPAVAAATTTGPAVPAAIQTAPQVIPQSVAPTPAIALTPGPAGAPSVVAPSTSTPAPGAARTGPSPPTPTQPTVVTSAPAASGPAPAPVLPGSTATGSPAPMPAALQLSATTPASTPAAVPTVTTATTSPSIAPTATPAAPSAPASVATAPQPATTQAPAVAPAQGATPNAAPPMADARASMRPKVPPATTPSAAANEQPQRASAPAPAPAAERAAIPTPSPARIATAPVLTLSQPAQAAAQQDSIVPLIKNLAAVATKLDQLPRPVADAAVRLLATPVVADRKLTGEALKIAVQRSGVFLDPPAKAGVPPVDVKASLLQLRAGLLALLDAGDIAPVAAVGRRPPPPLRDAQPRGQRADGPTLSADATPRDAARTLLHQTDAALSRLKLTQLASQPSDAVRAAAAAPDFMVELPMLLGAELGMLQLKVERDGKARSKSSERGWRVRFAVSFSAIGEVGAQVALLGKTTNVVVWADQADTADALEQMLPDLAPALAARGLTVGSVRLRRSAPGAEAPLSGRLMDTLT